MEANLAKMPEYVSLIDEYKRKERNLEDRIKDLCENLQDKIHISMVRPAITNTFVRWGNTVQNPKTPIKFQINK